MNRTIKKKRDAKGKRYHYDSHEHFQTLVHAYTSAKRLKALRGLTLFEDINKRRTDSTLLPDITCRD